MNNGSGVTVNLASSPAHWKFVPEDLDTSGLSSNEASYNDTLAISYTDLGSDHSFIGILVGDVNGTL